MMGKGSGAKSGYKSRSQGAREVRGDRRLELKR